MLDHFLNVVGVSLKNALLRFNLAPLSSRRHISLLGLIHKCQLGIAPTCLSRFPQKARSTLHNFNSNFCPVHDHQVACYVTPACPVIFRRSVFVLVRVYNKLPPDVVATLSVSTFQRRLQVMLKISTENDVGGWHELFNIK